MKKIEFVIYMVLTAINTALPFAEKGAFGKSSAKIALALKALRAAMMEVLTPPPDAAPGGPMMASRKPAKVEKFSGLKLAA